MENKSCKISKKCGGCVYSGVDYKLQLAEKQKLIETLMGKFCNAHGGVEPIIGMEKPLGYRHKVVRTFSTDRAGGLYSGLYEEGTHRVIRAEECIIEEQECLSVIKTIEKLAKDFKIRAYDEDKGTGLLRHVLVRKGFATGEIMAVLVLANFIFPGKNNFIRELTAAHPSVKTIVFNENHGKNSLILGKNQQVVYGRGFITDRLLGRSFKISPKSFYQVNPAQTERLYNTAVSFAGLTGREFCIDAYCGTGTIGIIAAERAGRVLGIELSPDAVRDAVANARENRVDNIKFRNADATEFLCEMAAAKTAPPEVLFMDPPRSGSTPEFISAAAALKVPKIVYISCNPETLARDAELFTGLGYKAERVQPVDMFPFTGHVECVVLMSREGK